MRRVRAGLRIAHTSGESAGVNQRKSGRGIEAARTVDAVGSRDARTCVLFTVSANCTHFARVRPEQKAQTSQEEHEWKIAPDKPCRS